MKLKDKIGAVTTVVLLNIRNSQLKDENESVENDLNHLRVRYRMCVWVVRFPFDFSLKLLGPVHCTYENIVVFDYS